jgi:hypothetical protein
MSEDRQQKIDSVARVAHETNRAYSLSLGDTSHSSWDEAPGWLKDSIRLGVERVLEGKDARQIHESWLAVKVAAGWKYGPVKDAEKKEHPCFRPYDSLPPEQQAKDHLFVATVERTARLVGLVASPGTHVHIVLSLPNGTSYRADTSSGDITLGVPQSEAGLFAVQLAAHARACDAADPRPPSVSEVRRRERTVTVPFVPSAPRRPLRPEATADLFLAIDEAVATLRYIIQYARPGHVTQTAASALERIRTLTGPLRA